jgi:hypothetical protein
MNNQVVRLNVNLRPDVAAALDDLADRIGGNKTTALHQAIMLADLLYQEADNRGTIQIKRAGSPTRAVELTKIDPGLAQRVTAAELQSAQGDPTAADDQAAQGDSSAAQGDSTAGDSAAQAASTAAQGDSTAGDSAAQAASTAAQAASTAAQAAQAAATAAQAASAAAQAASAAAQAGSTTAVDEIVLPTPLDMMIPPPPAAPGKIGTVGDEADQADSTASDRAT